MVERDPAVKEQKKKRGWWRSLLHRDIQRDRIIRPMVIASIIVGLLLLGASQVRQQMLSDDHKEVVADLKHEADLRNAASCVAQYDRVDQLRDLGEFIIQTNADTLLALPAPPEGRTAEQERTRAAFRSLVEGDIAEARRIVQIVNPCNLEKSKAVLETERNNG